MVKIDFSFETRYGTYRDALHLPDGHGLTPEQIAALQRKRMESWLDALDNPPAPEPEILELDGVRYEKVAIDGKIILSPVGV